MQPPTPQHDAAPNIPADLPPERIVRAAELFGEGREVVIEHDGERYRLRITRRGKLILQK